jgi:subtilisin family serine protease
MILGIPHSLQAQPQQQELFVKWKAEASTTQRSKARFNLAQQYGVIDKKPAFQFIDKINAKAKRDKSLNDLIQNLQRVERWVLPDSQSPALIAAKLSSHPDIEYAEPVPQDRLLATADDPEYQSGNQAYLSAINASTAWDVSTGAPNVLIAIIDSGTDIDHPDLQGNLWTNPAEADDGQDTDQNGYTDDLHGWDFYEDNNDVRPGSNNVHGTHVTGIAAATTNNGVGVASISYNVSYLPIKISDDAGEVLRNGYDAILYAASMGADVINCSWGSTQYSQTYADLIAQVTEMGSLVIGAGGNDATDAVYYPAGYSDAIAVANTNNDGSKSTSSNYGSFIDVNAPGTNILSTFPSNSYNTSSGTSMAAPVVSGLAGLVKSTFGDIDVDQLRAQLLATADRLTTGTSIEQYYLGRGQIRADAAVNELQTHPELVQFEISDKPGNDNGVLETGETIQIAGTIKNFGQDLTGAQLIVESLNTDKLQVVSDDQQPLDLPHSESFNFTPVKFKITNSAQIDDKVTVTFSYDLGTETRYDAIEVTLLPSYVTLTANTIETSVDGYGHIGYSDYNTNNVGTGFIIRSASTQLQSLSNSPLLYEGGLFFGDGASNNPGSNEFRISDHLRGSDPSVSNQDFNISQPVNLTTENGDQMAEVVFTDAGASAESYNIQVQQTTFAYGDAGHDQYLIFIYNFRNDSDVTYNDFNAGLFFDFDLPSEQANDDYGVYDEDNDLLIMQPDNSSDPGLYIGLTAIGGIQTPWVINNDDPNDDNPGFYFEIYDGFTDGEKWDALSVGVTSRGSENREVQSSDVSISASAQPIALTPNESEKMGFIVAYGTTKSELLTQIGNARQRAEDRQLTAIESIDPPAGERPQQTRIDRIYPNPFNPSTTIRYRLNQVQHVQLAVYNRLGQRVQMLQNGRQSPGYYQASLNGSQLASGIYYIVLKAEGVVVDRKAVTLVK